MLVFLDYFNYGFNENTWLAYCERQRKMRCNESLVGMATLAMHNPQVPINTTNNNVIPTIDIKSSIKFQVPNVPPKENTIEVCTSYLNNLVTIHPGQRGNKSLPNHN